MAEREEAPQGTPRTAGLTTQQLERFIKQLKSIKPNNKNQYIFGGKTYTKAGWNKFVGGYEDQLGQLKKGGTVSAEGGAYVFSAAGQAQLKKDAEIARIDKLGQSVFQLVRKLKSEADKSLSVTEQNNLRKWIVFYENEMKRLETYANSLSNGGFIRDIPEVKLLSVADIKKIPAGTSPEVAVGRGEMGQPATATPTTTSPQAQPPTSTPNISTIKTKDQARTEIQNTRARINKLRGLVGERQSNGVVLYFEAPGVQPGMTAMQRDAIIASSEARIAALNTKFFAETPAAGGTPAASQPPATGVAPTTPAAGGETTPFVPGAGETAFGATLQPGRMVPEAGVTTPPTTPTTPPATQPGTRPVTQPVTQPGTQPGTQPVTQPGARPGTTPAPPAPAAGQPFTDPATGTTYQPGEQIGGEDRALPNGGAVVDGIYIPPGINYTWLGSQIPEDWKTAAQELYGAYYDMIKNDPQISKLLEDAIKNSWSPEKFQVELEKTDWWRTTTANARQFQILETTDPATARAQLDERIVLVRETAQRLGITLDSESLERMARNAINLGFNLTAQVEDLVGSEAIRTAGGVSQLRYGYLGNSLRESARKYGVALSDVTFNEWLNKIAVGSESVETFESYANQIARTLYPTLSSGFDRGLSFGQMTDPYAQVASRILEIPTAQVDFTDPKWAQAFTMKNAAGEQVPMSFGEWADYLRTTPSFGYQFTDDARSKAYNVVDQLARAFGAA